MENSKIEWTHHTFNPWIGCTKISDGCKNCYAEELMDKRYGRVKWGVHGLRVRTSKSNWKQPNRWNKAAKEAGVRARVFCASLADIFEDKPDQQELNDWRRDLFGMIINTPYLDWLLLTKRPENVNHMIEQATGFSDAETWFHAAQNVWIGTSVENQGQADKRIPELLKIPAKIRFLSCEPLLGHVDLRKFSKKSRGLTLGHDWLTGEEWQYSEIFGGGKNIYDFDPQFDDYGKNRIHWVIAGGESGHNARPMHPDWVRSLRYQCQEAGVPFLFKQWGEWGWTGHFLDYPFDENGLPIKDYRLVSFPDKTVMVKVGKHSAGRLLDGREWNEFPGVTA